MRPLRARPWLSTAIVTAVVSIGAVLAVLPHPSSRETVGVEQTAPVLDTVENHSRGREAGDANQNARASFIPAGHDASADRTALSSGPGASDATRHRLGANSSRNARPLPQPPHVGPARAAWLTGSIEAVENYGRGTFISPDDAVLLPRW